MNLPLAQVLAVEDHPDLASVLQRTLALAQVQVTVAPTGERGLELARQHPYDLILLDIGLPGINGLELCRLLKADAQLKLIPVIFVSGEFGKGFEQEARRLGAVDFITKPFEVLPFLACVLGHLNLRMVGGQDIQKLWPLPPP